MFGVSVPIGGESYPPAQRSQSRVRNAVRGAIPFAAAIPAIAGAGAAGYSAAYGSAPAGQADDPLGYFKAIDKYLAAPIGNAIREALGKERIDIRVELDGEQVGNTVVERVRRDGRQGALD